MKNEPIVLRAFRGPQSTTALSLGEWDLLIRQARHANLLASLYSVLKEGAVLDTVPAKPREHLEWAWMSYERHAQAVAWEVWMIKKALAGLGAPLILLKGAAYVMADLPAARGRIFSDIDILVPKDALNAVEAALMLHGWAGMHLDQYDQRYYRTWMHELPPMRHIKRATVIDVHHAIVPETAPVRPDPAKLRSEARPLNETGDVCVLSPADMVLHSAVHLFHDGEFDHGLRDLIDIHRLLSHFGQQPRFWSLLVERSIELELARPLFYALRYATRLLGTTVPDEVIAAAAFGRPRPPMLTLMDRLFLRALVPDHPSCADWLRPAAKQALYVRANWLRMPPLLLARHLFHKAFISPDKD